MHKRAEVMQGRGLKSRWRRREQKARRRDGTVEHGGKQFFEVLESRVLLSSVAYPIGTVDLVQVSGLLPMTGADGELYIAGSGGLTRSDGETTTKLISGPVQSLFNWNGTLYFQCGIVTGDSFFRLDPGSSTPVEIKAGKNRISSAKNFVSGNTKLYFSGLSGLYVTDGTSEGTILLHSTGQPIGTLGDKLFFRESIGATTDLWMTDGTIAGTVKLVSNLSAYSGVELNGALLFAAADGLYRSDGTAAGTFRISTLRPTADIRRVGNVVYGVQAVTEGTTLLRSDGTSAGTVAIKTQVAYPSAASPQSTFASIGDTLYFIASDTSQIAQVFSTNGAGTTKQITKFTGPSNSTGVVTGLIQVNGQLFFPAETSTGGFGFWTSNGTANDYHLVSGFAPGFSSWPLNVTPVGASVYFTNALSNNQNQLWRYGVTGAALADDGTLAVNGTTASEGGTGADTISLAIAGENLIATVNGTDFPFLKVSVKRIVVNAMSGNDSLELAPDLLSAGPEQITYNGGSGIETLLVRGTDANDAIDVGSEQISMNEPSGTHKISLRGVENVSIDAGIGNDVINIAANPALNLNVNANEGDDTVKVGAGLLESVTGQVTLDAGAGNDSLIFDDSSNAVTSTLISDYPPTPAGDRYALNDSQLTRTRAGTLTIQTFHFSAFAGGVSLIAGTSPNSIIVTPSVASEFTISGGDPTLISPSAFADSLAIVLSGAAGALLSPSNEGSGKYSFSNRKPVNFTGIEVPDDLASPSVVRSSFVYTKLPEQLQFRFSEPIVPAGLIDKILLVNRTTGITIPTSVLPLSYGLLSNTETFTFDGATMGLLSQGVYRATLPAGTIKDAAGNSNGSDYTFDFVALQGDTNGDGRIGFEDLVAVAQHYNTVGATIATGDTNYDGVVGFSDLVTIAQHYNTAGSITTGLIGAASQAETEQSATPGLVASEIPSSPIVNPAFPLPAPVQNPPVSPGIGIDMSWGMTGKTITDLNTQGISDDWLVDAKLTPSGKLVVLGGTPNYSSGDIAIVRYNQDGTFDESFGDHGLVRYHHADRTVPIAAYLQDDGKLIVAGWSTTYGGNTPGTHLVLARFKEDGTLDASFGQEGATIVDNGTVSSMIVLSDGKILVGGHIGGTDGYAALWRFNDNGTVDGTFGMNGLLTIDQKTSLQGMHPAAALSGGRALVNTNLGMQMLNPDGTFAPGFLLAAGVAAIQTDGKILVTNNADSPNAGNIFVTRYTAAGAVDSSFGTNGSGTVIIDMGGNDTSANVVLQNDGKILVGGTYSTAINPVDNFAFARLNSDGSFDSSFGVGGKWVDPFDPGNRGNDSLCKLIYSDGTLIAIGTTKNKAPEDVSNINVSDNFAIARYVLDPSIKIQTGGPYGTVNEGALFTVNANGSSYANGQIIKYEWDYGYDGHGFSVDAEGISAQLQAGDDPTATIGLRVTTSDGIQSIASTTVQIRNLPPLTEAGPDRVSVVGNPVNLKVSASDAVSEAITFTIDWGDGTTPSVKGPITGASVSAAVSHTFSSRGLFTVTVTTSDGDGGISSDFTTVRIGDVLATVYIDSNGNGSIDSNETTPVIGQRVYLDTNRNGIADAGERVSFTDDQGRALFDQLAPDVYSVRIDPVIGYQFSSPVWGATDANVWNGAGVALNFGVTQLSSISGSLFTDTNGNGIWDLGELPVTSSRVSLVSLGGGSSVTALTDAFGIYRFSGVSPGTYIIRATGPGGIQTVPAAGRGRVVSIGSAGKLNGIDLGFTNTTPASIAGTVFEDADGNGVKGASEKGASGRVVYLDANNNNIFDVDELSATITSTGTYLLTNLPQGQYVVRLVPRAGWAQSLPATDSYTITLASGQAVTAKDFGTQKVDLTPPAVFMTFDPANSQITLQFSEPITGLTSGDLSVTHLPGNESMPYTLSGYDALTGTAIFAPESALAPGNYVAILPATSVADLAGNSFAPAFVFNFSTVPVPAPLPLTTTGTNARDEQSKVFNSKTPIRHVKSLPVRRRITLR